MQTEHIQPLPQERTPKEQSGRKLGKKIRPLSLAAREHQIRQRSELGSYGGIHRPATPSFLMSGGGSSGGGTDAPLTSPTQQPVSLIEGQGSTPAIATFSDTDTNGANSSFTATIVWSDGSTESGMVQSLGGGRYSVRSSRSFNEEGSFQATVTITDTGNPGFDTGGSTTTITNTVQVSDASITSVGNSLSVPSNLPDSSSSAPEVTTTEQNVVTSDPAAAMGPQVIYADDEDTGGNTFGNSSYSIGTLATFTDANPLEPTSAYTATIDWADGSPVEPGTVTSGGSGRFTIQSQAGHNYDQPGVYMVAVNLLEDGAQVAMASSTITATPQPSAQTSPPELDASTVNDVVFLDLHHNNKIGNGGLFALMGKDPNNPAVSNAVAVQGGTKTSTGAVIGGGYIFGNTFKDNNNTGLNVIQFVREKTTVTLANGQKKQLTAHRFVEGYQMVNGLSQALDAHVFGYRFQPGEVSVTYHATIQFGFGDYDNQAISGAAVYPNADPFKVNWMSKTATYSIDFTLDNTQNTLSRPQFPYVP